ncbi:MAG: HD domain-containing protein [candidate division WOR-3 bacterium]|nr:HD domain-containing protein [candidate division WOR-3 bacterium]
MDLNKLYENQCCRQKPKGILSGSAVFEKINKLQNIRPCIDILLKISSDKEIYLVGGALRDILLGYTPADFDFVVSGSGIKFAQRFAKETRGALVVLSLEDDEARVVINKDLIFDFNGLNTRTLAEDLYRRDFTINALALSLKNPRRIIDEFEGIKHLKARLIVPVSEQSLELDPLRILRAFRLALMLKFRIDKKLINMATRVNLSVIAPERISYEFLKITENEQSFFYIKLMYRLGLLQQIFPLARKLFDDPVLTHHSLRTYKKIEEVLVKNSFFDKFPEEKANYFKDFPYRKALLKISGLFHDIGKPDTQFFTSEGDVHFYGHDNLGAKFVAQIGRENLRLSRRQIQMLKNLVLYHMRLHLLATAPMLTDRAIRRFFRDVGEEYFGLMILTYADGYATAGRTDHLEKTIERMIALKRADEAKKRVVRLITGDDLISWGYRPGPIFKVILQELEDLQLEGKIKTKEEGYEYVKTHYPVTAQ